MKLTHLGHACLLLETTGAEGAAPVRLLLDPGVFSTGWQDLTDLDAVLITHDHADHVDDTGLHALLAASPGAVLATEPATAARLAEHGARPLAAGEHLEVRGVRVEAVGGDHAVIHPDVPRIGNTGLVVRAPGEPVLFHPGDSYGTAPEGVDVLALPISSPWGKLSEAADLVRAVAPSVVVPVHDALFSEIGRGVHLSILGQLLPEGTRVVDTGGRGELQL